MPTARLPRYPAIIGGCDGCGGPINRDRAGSRLEYICNMLINPRPPDQPDRVPRRYIPDVYEWDDRLAVVQALHAELRGGLPGWGRLEIHAIVRQYDEMEANAYRSARLELVR